MRSLETKLRHYNESVTKISAIFRDQQRTWQTAIDCEGILYFGGFDCC